MKQKVNSQHLILDLLRNTEGGLLTKEIAKSIKKSTSLVHFYCKHLANEGAVIIEELEVKCSPNATRLYSANKEYVGGEVPQAKREHVKGCVKIQQVEKHFNTAPSSGIKAISKFAIGYVEKPYTQSNKNPNYTPSGRKFLTSG